MATKTLIIGTKSFEIPLQGANAPWAEDLTAFFEAVADSLATVQGPNDILITTATLANNQSSLANIPGMVFNTGDVQGVEIEYLVVRIYDTGTSTSTEYGKILGSYNGTEFSISRQFSGDAGFDFDVTNAGQVQYKSSNLSNHVSTEIRFKAKTIDQP